MAAARTAWLIPRGLAVCVPLLSCTAVQERTTNEGCASCHGTDPNAAAPPPDLLESTESSSRGVGAHQQHLFSPTLGSPIACTTCHVVPEAATDPGHLDTTPEQQGTPADVVFSGIASAGGTSPTYDISALTCTDSWCHSRPGAAFPEPQWTLVDGSQITCAGCHGNPPPVPHPQLTDCASCHDSAAADGGIADPTLHINGVVDVDTDTLACNACHGTNASAPAPPPDLARSSDTSARGVGAHATHLAGGTSSKPVECTACHLVPTLASDAGHIDAALPADVLFVENSLSRSDGAQPTYDTSALTCAGSYCHGATLSGGTLTAPTWTTVDSTQNACGTCHGLPPSLPHPQRSDCSNCHPDASAGPAISDATLHIDGVVQVAGVDSLACNTCHGTDPTNPAPPPALDGGVTTSAAGVGAHATHLSPTLSVAVACDECHLVPTSVSAAGHLDSMLPAEVVFPDNGLAANDGADPSYDSATATCSNVYCHGAGTELTPAGGVLTLPTWTVVNGTFSACGTCHAVPPATHPATFTTCSTCHPTDGDSAATPDPAMHINGVIDTVF